MRAPHTGKPFSLVFNKIAGLLFFSVLAFHFSAAQKKHSGDSVMTYYPEIKFILHAPELLPRLADQQQWTEMRNFLDNWSHSPFASRELIFALQTLLSIQINQHGQVQPHCDALLYLQDYSRELKNTVNHNTRFKYFIQLPDHYRYDATAGAGQTLIFIRSWAKKLLQSPHLSAEQIFLCRVFSGVIDDPLSYYKSNPKAYPSLIPLQGVINNENENYFSAKRNGPAIVASIMIGSWVPTGHLMTLGIHPSFGVQLGLRNKLNEYDLTYNCRLVRSANSFLIVRSDSVLVNTHYDGGYVGFEYTRYLLHHKYFDAGLTSGVGYDYFSVQHGPGDVSPGFSYLPITVGVFNFSNGVRLKYFFRKRHFVGLTAKYNLVHYPNPGGTNLSGNAYTIDLVYGGH
jgi:hypothetical protein